MGTAVKLNERVVGWDGESAIRGHVVRIMLAQVVVQPDGGGEMVHLHDGEFRKERFSEYLFARKEGFGRTPWPRFILVQLASLLMLALSIIWFREAWLVTAVVLLSEAFWAVGTIRNFKGLQG